MKSASMPGWACRTRWSTSIEASRRLSGAPLEAAGYLMDRLAGGLLGPRCAAYCFNSFSVKSALQEIPVCQTFSLPAPQSRTHD